MKSLSTFRFYKNQLGRGLKNLFRERDTDLFSRIVKENRRRTHSNITVVINEIGTIRFAEKRFNKKLENWDKHTRRFTRMKVAIRQVNIKIRVHWCKERKDWTVQQEWWKWIFCNESQIVKIQPIHQHQNSCVLLHRENVVFEQRMHLFLMCDAFVFNVRCN